MRAGAVEGKIPGRLQGEGGGILLRALICRQRPPSREDEVLCVCFVIHAHGPPAIRRENQSYPKDQACAIYPPGYRAGKYPPGYVGAVTMTHAIHEKQKLLNRIRRVRGQVDAVERALESEESCTQVMRLLTAARGALNGMMAEVVEDHIQMHMMEANRKPAREEIEAADELVEVLRSYIK